MLSLGLNEKKKPKQIGVNEILGSGVIEPCLSLILHLSLAVVPFINSSPPGQNGRHLADDIFRFIFVNENFYILIKISLKFFPKGPIGNNPALV